MEFPDIRPNFWRRDELEDSVLCKKRLTTTSAGVGRSYLQASVKTPP